MVGVQVLLVSEEVVAREAVLAAYLVVGGRHQSRRRSWWLRRTICLCVIVNLNNFIRFPHVDPLGLDDRWEGSCLGISAWNAAI